MELPPAILFATAILYPVAVAIALEKKFATLVASASAVASSTTDLFVTTNDPVLGVTDAGKGIILIVEVVWAGIIKYVPKKKRAASNFFILII
jgi:hypothetical protein